MLEFTKNITQRLPVVLKDTSGNPKNAVAFGSVTMSIIKGDGTQLDISVASASWITPTGTAYASQGYYNVLMDSSSLSVTGTFQYCVLVSGAVPYFGVIKVTDGDTGATYNRLGTPAGASVSADIATTNANAASAASNASSAASNASTAAANAASANSNAITAATNASSAATNANNANNNILIVSGNLGTTFLSGTVAAGISATYHAVLNVSGGGGSGSADLTPILTVLGRPVTTIAQDIFQVAKLVKNTKK